MNKSTYSKKTLFSRSLISNNYLAFFLTPLFFYKTTFNSMRGSGPNGLRHQAVFTIFFMKCYSVRNALHVYNGTLTLQIAKHFGNNLILRSFRLRYCI